MTTLLRRVAASTVAGAFALTGLVAVTGAPVQAQPAFDSSCTPARPVLKTLKVSPTKVNVKTGKRTVTVSGTTSGPALSYLSVFGSPPAGKGPSRSGYDPKPKAHSFSAKIVVPKGAANAKHSLTIAMSSADSSEYYSTLELQEMGLPHSFNVISKPDLKAPKLKKIKFSVKKVNTTKKTAKVKVTATGTDAGGSGIEGAWVNLGRGDKSFSYAVLKRKKKQLVGTATIPKWIGSGKVTVVYASISDVAGNSTYYNYGTGSAKLTAKLKPKVKVTAKKDSAKPTVSSVSASPKSVKVGDRRHQISFSVKAADKQAGVSSVQVSLVPQGDTGWETAWAYLSRGKNGTWTGKGVVDCYDSAGTYDVVVVARDAVGNELRTTRGTVTLTS